MKFAMTKLAATMALTLAATGAQAVAVTSWDLIDFNSDGLISDFAFYSAPAGNSGNKFGRLDTTGAATAPNCPASGCVAIAMNTGAIGSNVFTSGFDFGGTGIFMPNIFGNIAANIDTSGPITSSDLTFSALDFGGLFNGVQFNLAPNGGTSSVVVESLVDLGGGNYGTTIRYVSTVVGGTFNGFQANWRLEGVLTAVPEASTYGMMLAGLGLVGGMVARRRKLLA